MGLIRNIDPIQDIILAARRCLDDCRNCQQRHAVTTLLLGCRWAGAWSCSYNLPGIVRTLHELAAYQV